MDAKIKYICFLVLVIFSLTVWRRGRAYYRKVRKLHSLRSINALMERSKRNLEDYKEHARDCFLKGSVNEAKEFEELSKEEYSKILQLHAEFENINQPSS